MKSASCTFRGSRRAAVSAASLTRFRRSAPTIPGVLAAIASRSTSSASGTPRVWTSRMSRRPVWSGGFTATRRSNRPGRSSAESSTSGRLVEAITITPSDPEKPSISVRIWFRVCSRSSWPPRLDAAAAGPADGVELVDEDDRRRRLLGLVEQVAHAARADADDRLDELRRREREERHAGLARHGPREQRLAGARRPREQDAARDARAELACTAGVAQEVDDLDQLVLGLVDAGHVVEVDRSLVCSAS